MNRQNVVIVPFGAFPHPKGEQVIDSSAASRILSRLKEWGRDIVVDYMHESFKGEGRAPAAGWVKSSTAKITKNGVEAVIEWTSAAQKAIAAKEYRFLSPVFESSGGLITGLVNLGLTNNPNIHAMPPLINQLQPQETIMQKDVAASLKEKLGLTESAQNADIESAVESLMARPASLAAALGDVVALLGLGPDATGKEILDKIESLARDCADSKECETDQLVNDAISAGKLRPALSDWAKKLGRINPESLKVFLLNSGPSIPLGGVITIGGEAKPRLTESEANVCKLLNISESDFIKYGSQ